jgi:hypothetical protein
MRRPRRLVVIDGSDTALWTPVTVLPSTDRSPVLGARAVRVGVVRRSPATPPPLDVVALLARAQHAQVPVHDVVTHLRKVLPYGPLHQD